MKSRIIRNLPPGLHNHRLRTHRAAGLFAIAVVAVLLGLSVRPAHALEWSDTFLGDRYGTQYREPANPNDITKDILQLQHADGYVYGTNFFNIDMLMSDSKDPAAAGGGGAQEVYIVYRNTLSLSKVSGTPCKFGPISDLGVTAGFDFNSKDDQFASRVREFYFGPTVSFDVPGFFSVSLLLRTEHNHNGIVGKNVTFNDTWAINSAWGIPIKGTPLVFKGFFNVIGPKGKDGFGGETKTEILTEPELLCDISSFMGHKGTVFAGVGYQYWRNKFGNDSSKDPSGGSIAKVPQLVFEWHF
jgi:nucleoside-specific outer membrane channel protein Tsx